MVIQLQGSGRIRTSDVYCSSTKLYGWRSETASCAREPKQFFAHFSTYNAEMRCFSPLSGLQSNSSISSGRNLEISGFRKNILNLIFGTSFEGFPESSQSECVINERLPCAFISLCFYIVTTYVYKKVGLLEWIQIPGMGWKKGYPTWLYSLITLQLLVGFYYSSTACDHTVGRFSFF